MQTFFFTLLPLYVKIMVKINKNANLDGILVS